MSGTPRAIPLLALTALLAGGCASVRPQAAVRDPVPVYIGDFGVHSGLFLPTPDGRYAEFQFADWRYAAENKCWPQDAVIALAASPGAAFGRRYHDPVPGGDAPHLTPKPISLQRVDCERVEVYDLYNRLNDHFEQLADRQGKPVRNPESGVEFVRDAGHYSLLNNCNHLTARSLRELGCEVSGVVVWSKFRVEDGGRQAAVPASGVATVGE